jgi:hypothetical protein
MFSQNRFYEEDEATFSSSSPIRSPSSPIRRPLSPIKCPSCPVRRPSRSSYRRWNEVVYDTPEEVERVWREFDLRYPIFKSNGLYNIIRARKYFTYINRFNEKLDISVGYYESTDGNIFNVIVRYDDKVIVHNSATKDENYPLIDRLIEADIFDVKEPGIN